MLLIHTRKLDPIHKKMGKDAIEFCVRKFLSRIRNPLTIMLHGQNNLMAHQGIYASCDRVDWEEKTAREFVIKIDTSLPIEIFLSSLMHEMIHVKQYAKGELGVYARDPSFSRWKGEKINREKLSYYDEPWEIEAHGYEVGLVQQFLDEKPEWNNFVYGSVKDHKMYRSPQMVFSFYR